MMKRISTTAPLPSVKRTQHNDVLHAINCAAISLKGTLNTLANNGLVSLAVDPDTVTSDKLHDVSRRLGVAIEYDGMTYADFS